MSTEEMSDEEINLAVGKIAGKDPAWWRCRNHGEVPSDRVSLDYPVCPWCGEGLEIKDQYSPVTSLDAVALAERALSDEEYHQFTVHLVKKAYEYYPAPSSGLGKFHPSSRYAFSASAKDRCIALLRATEGRAK